MKNKSNIKVFFSLMLLSFVPFLYSFIRMAIVNQMPDTSAVDILGQIEWFDLIDETLQAFLIVPLYSILNKIKPENKQFAESITLTGIISFLGYSLFSIIVMIYAQSLVSAMGTDNIAATTEYLRLETVAFIIGIVASFANVVFVILGKASYIVAITIVKTIITIMEDILLIPLFGVNGVAFSNITVNFGIAVLCLLILVKNKYISFNFSKQNILKTIKNYVITGLFAGGEIFLNNFIYAVMVCKIINVVSSQGIYWEANNFIWGFLLIPISALSEIIKQETNDKLLLKDTKKYLKTVAYISAIWLLTIPLDYFLLRLMGADIMVFYIVIGMLPFYIAYAVTAVIDSQFVGLGITQYNFIISIGVNIIYYGAWFLAFRAGFFPAKLITICLEFGFGMVVHLILSLILLKTKSFRDNHKSVSIS